MDEIVYMVGSAAAVTLLVGHVVRFLVVKLKPRARPEQASVQAFESVCMELRDELRQLREDQALAIDELAERVEFAERLLARSSQRDDEGGAVAPR
jgi:uncharacterized membrane-anchored protein YhcB (DUF1043 family)